MQELKRRAAPLAVLACLLGAYGVAATRSGNLIQAVAVSLMVVIAAALAVWPRVRWLVPVVVPLLVAGVLAQFRPQGDVGAAVLVPAVFGLVAAVLLAAGVDVNGGVDRGVRVVERLLRAVIGGVAFAIAILPAWAWTRLRRRDVLRTAEAQRGPTWERHGDVAEPTSPAASPEVAGTRRTASGKLTWAVGCVTVLLALNFGIGWVWDQAYPTDPPTPTAAQQPSSAPAAPDDAPLPPDPRASLPAMADYPWRDQYFDDLRRTPAGYWPFTEYRPADYTSEYINQRDWTRVSYEPEGDPEAMPAVWMFGGSTTWGEGQRDEHTIPSELARIAEREGVPLRIANYGARGWVHFQEMLLFEQQLARSAAPDFALFYDGANEITAQSQVTEAAPAHTLTYEYAEKLRGMVVATEATDAEQADDAPTMGDAYDAYVEHSAIHKLVGLFRSRAAGASPSQDAGDGTTPTAGTSEGAGGGSGPGTGIEPPTSADGSGTSEQYLQDGVDAAEVYERGKRLTQDVAAEHDVDLLLYWQPMLYGQSAPFRAATDRISDSTIDITDALDGHEDVYLDGGHTNEVGARIVAERIWKDLGPKVRAWYEEHR